MMTRCNVIIKLNRKTSLSMITSYSLRRSERSVMPEAVLVDMNEQAVELNRSTAPGSSKPTESLSEY